MVICYKKHPAFSICKTARADNIMYLLQMDGNELTRRVNKHVTRDNIVAKKEKICYL